MKQTTQTASEAFKQAYSIVLAHEGGYAFHPADRGRETFRGISRRHWPLWPGWGRVDAVVKELKIPFADAHHSRHLIDSALKDDATLQILVQGFYLHNFWLATKCHVVAMRDEVLALLLYDAAVQHGPAQAIKFLQETLNLLNKRQELWEDLVCDGQFGNRTEVVFEKACGFSAVGDKSVRVWYILVRGAFYTQIMRSSDIQEAFARGWGNRMAYWMVRIFNPRWLDRHVSAQAAPPPQTPPQTPQT